MMDEKLMTEYERIRTRLIENNNLLQSIDRKIEAIHRENISLSGEGVLIMKLTGKSEDELNKALSDSKKQMIKIVENEVEDDKQPPPEGTA